MKSHSQLLYEVFEHHLFANNSAEDSAFEPFIEKVVKDYLTKATKLGFIFPQNSLRFIEDDLKEEVLDMTRKRTYGFHSIEDYRKKAKRPSRQKKSY